MALVSLFITSAPVQLVVFACLVQAFHNIGFFRAVALLLRNELGIEYIDIYSEILAFSLENPESACGSVANLVRNFAEGMSKGENPWAVACDSLGDICWQFDEIYFLKSLEKADEIFDELESFILNRYGESRKLRAVFDIILP